MNKKLTYMLTATFASTLMAAPFVVGQLWLWLPSWWIVLGYALIGWLPLWGMLRFSDRLETPAKVVAPMEFLDEDILERARDEDTQHTTEPEHIPAPPNLTYARTIFFAGLCWSLLLCTWHLSATRATGAKILSSQRLRTPLETCNKDPDPNVAIACCQALEPLGTTTQQATYARWLVRHPDHANLCMVKSINGTSTVANELVNLAVQKWSHHLMNADQTSDKTKQDKLCQQASYLRHLDRVSNAYTSAHLLMCTTSATSDVSRQCCDQQLKLLAGHNQSASEALPDPQRLAKTPFQRHGPTLLNKLLPSFDARLETQRQQAIETLTFSVPAMQHWSILLACHSLKSAAPRLKEQLMSRLSIGLSATGCGANEDQITYIRMLDVCAKHASLQSLPEDPAKHMCTTMKLDATQVAIHQSRRLVRASQFTASAPFWQPKDKLMRAILVYEPKHIKRFESERTNNILNALRGPKNAAGKFMERDMFKRAFRRSKNKRPRKRKR